MAIMRIVLVENLVHSDSRIRQNIFTTVVLHFLFVNVLLLYWKNKYICMLYLGMCAMTFLENIPNIGQRERTERERERERGCSDGKSKLTKLYCISQIYPLFIITSFSNHTSVRYLFNIFLFLSLRSHILGAEHNSL